MDSINWSEFDGDKFQSFCNVLLSFEVSNSYVPFDAPGADGGIDGWYEGEYKKIKGKWRFQAKFSHPETGRIASANYLKGLIREDLNNNLKDETHVVFITNTSIGPKKRKELLNEGNSTIKCLKKKVKLDIWDAAKIRTIVAKYPIIDIWYGSNNSYMLQGYKDYFEKQIESDSDNLEYTLSNTYYFREQAIDKLNDFVTSDKYCTIVSGQAGIGKTRLCVEFFDKFINLNDAWIVLVLTNHRIDYKLLQKGLEGNKNVILFLDDAHRFNPMDVSDLITLISSKRSNKVKLILTARSYYLDSINSDFKSANKKFISTIPLDKFTQKETVEFLEKELVGFRIDEYVRYWVSYTNGNPLMLVTLVRLIKNGLSPSEIVNDDFITDYIANHFRDFIQLVHIEKEVPKKEVKRILNAITLIEPIDINDSSLITAISENEDVSNADVQDVLEYMSLNNLFSGGYYKSIKPDLYSDLLLKDAIKKNKWLERKLFEYSQFLENSIRNIVSIDTSDYNETFIKNIILRYIERISDCKEYSLVIGILKTITDIAYTYPDLGYKSIELTMKICYNKKHQLYEQFNQTLTNGSPFKKELITAILDIIRIVFNQQGYHSKAFYKAGELFKLTKDQGLASGLAKFNSNDYYRGFTCEKQFKILELCRKELDNSDSTFKEFSIFCLKNMLVLEFFETSNHLYENYNINITTIRVPANKHVKKLREDIINLLTTSYFVEKEILIKDPLLSMVIDIPGGIFAVKSKGYYNKNEIVSVLDFLFQVSKDPLELKYRRQIKDKLYWFNRWGLEESLHSKADDIVRNLTKDEPLDQLMKIVNPEPDLKDLGNENFETKALEFISTHSIDVIGESLAQVVNNSQYIPAFLYPFIKLISSNEEKSKSILEFYWNNNKDFALNYCESLFRKLRFGIDTEVLYWEYVQDLLHENTIASRNLILWVYGFTEMKNFLDIHDERINSKDESLIIKVISNSTLENYFSISKSICSLFFINVKVAVNEIVKFIKGKENISRNIDLVFYFLRQLIDNYYLEVKKIIFEHTVEFNINHSIEQILIQITKKEGFEQVLEYFKERYLFERNNRTKDKYILNYEAFPHHGNNSFVSGLSENERLTVFEKMLEWYLEIEFDKLEYFYSDYIFEYVSQTNHVTDEQFIIYNDLIDKHNRNFKSLLALLYSLKSFTKKNKNLIDIVVSIIDHSAKNFNSENSEKIIYQSYNSIYTLGVKSGTPGEPFPEDVELRDLLLEVLKDSSLKIESKTVIQKVLKSVESDIDLSKRDIMEEGW